MSREDLTLCSNKKGKGQFVKHPVYRITRNRKRRWAATWTPPPLRDRTHRERDVYQSEPAAAESEWKSGRGKWNLMMALRRNRRREKENEGENVRARDWGRKNDFYSRLRVQLYGGRGNEEIHDPLYTQSVQHALIDLENIKNESWVVDVFTVFECVVVRWDRPSYMRLYFSVAWNAVSTPELDELIMYT